MVNFANQKCFQGTKKKPPGKGRIMHYRHLKETYPFKEKLLSLLDSNILMIFALEKVII